MKKLLVLSIVPLLICADQQTDPFYQNVPRGFDTIQTWYSRLLWHTPGTREWHKELEAFGITRRRSAQEWLFDGQCYLVLGKRQASRSLPIFRAVHWMQIDLQAFRGRDNYPEILDFCNKLEKHIQYAQELAEYREQKATHDAWKAAKGKTSWGLW